jgi:hypothetical protein
MFEVAEHAAVFVCGDRGTAYSKLRTPRLDSNATICPITST